MAGLTKAAPCRVSLGRVSAHATHETRHPNPDLAARFGLHVVIGTLSHLVQTQPAALKLTDNRLTSELARVFRAYLGAVSTHAAL
jgi:dsRNA-specific ribonuclease